MCYIEFSVLLCVNFDSDINFVSIILNIFIRRRWKARFSEILPK